MRRAIFTIKTIVLLLVLLTSVSCMGTWKSELCETPVAQTLTAVAATQKTRETPTATPLPPIEVAFKSHHSQYVTAMGVDHNWALRQETELSECGWFTQHHLANGKIALVTCHGRYVTAPISGTTRLDWMLGQEPGLGRCGQFDLYALGNDRVAFKTCAGNFFTAGDGSWPPPLQWSVVAETDILQDWEIFTVLQQ